MLRIIICITAFVLMFVLSSCATVNDGELLSVTFPTELDITLKCDCVSEEKNFLLVLADKNKGQIRFCDKSGEENGYYIDFENGKAQIVYGETKTPLPDEIGQRIFVFSSVFTPDKEDLISVGLSDESGEKNNLLTYSVYLPPENEGEERKYSGEVSTVIDSETKLPIKISGELCGEEFEAVINY